MRLSQKAANKGAGYARLPGDDVLGNVVEIMLLVELSGSGGHGFDGAAKGFIGLGLMKMFFRTSVAGGVAADFFFEEQAVLILSPPHMIGR